MSESHDVVPSDGLAKILEVARRHLQMDLSFLAEFRDGEQVFRGIAGDAASFGWSVDGALPLHASYCRRMTDGVLPHVVPDTADAAAVRDLAVTADARIGSYVGVPVRLPDGTLYGSLCTVSHARHALDDKDARFLGLLAELVGVEASALLDDERVRTSVQQLLDDEDLQTAYQPVVDLVTGRARGLEALSRFPGRQGPPDEVFAQAHRVGLGVHLERLAVERALRVLPLLGAGQHVAVNATPQVAVALAASWDTADLPLDQIVLEITEHAAVENYAELRDSLAGCRARGLRLAIDDTGAGYASLHHVVELGPDIVKVDRSLVSGLAHDRARQSVVRAFAGLSADLGAELVAEGVEEAQDLVAAHALGAGAAQGWYLARPSTSRQQVHGWLQQLWCTPALAAAPSVVRT